MIATNIEEENKIAMITERKIEEARVLYKPIAIHSSVLFFCAIGMSSQDKMYQFSLRWFINHYEHCLATAE
jgi:dynein heavy chain